MSTFETEIVRLWTLTAGFVIEKERLNRENHFLAYYDYLTRIPNRRLFHERLTRELSLAQSMLTGRCVALLDLNDFKEINDRWGHDQGDLVLVIVADRMTQVIRRMDTVARMGGDEFAFIFPALPPVEVNVMVENILRAVRQPIVTQAVTLEISASIGIASYPADGTDGSTLLRKADIALYAAKRARLAGTSDGMKWAGSDAP
ncbi:GGDEF domain-containing protein [Alicyclobacillus contaminans]|uniref:GGDEF domain-containing protein n=1 Tax=Alicyclobacillus contaminans TaxID=392016 RepID=UPI00146FA8B6|nr:GGDEF domain-containing protein [Alicyclobacillus contaminans]